MPPHALSWNEPQVQMAAIISSKFQKNVSVDNNIVVNVTHVCICMGIHAEIYTDFFRISTLLAFAGFCQYMLRHDPCT